MKKKILALVLALTMCFGTTMTANAAMIVKNDMGALTTANTINKNTSKIPKGTLQYLASKFKIEYTQEDLDALKKIFDADLYAKAYPDVAAAYGNDREALWNHYVTHGIKEGRTQINSTFNVFAYIAAYPDLRNAFGDDLMAYYVHYANYGMNENRKLITVDAVTKAGYTITGINGQVIAVPKLEPAPSTVDSVTEPDPAPVEEPASAQTPAPSVTPTPTPEEPSGTTCNHKYGGVKQIEGTTTHGPVCIKCGYVDKEQAVGCEASHYDIIDKQMHKAICKECGGVITKEEHSFSEWRSDDDHIHVGICKCGNEEEQNHSYKDGICSICLRSCTHSDGLVKDEENNIQKCNICGFVEKINASTL